MANTGVLSLKGAGVGVLAGFAASAIVGLATKHKAPTPSPEQFMVAVVANLVAWGVFLDKSGAKPSLRSGPWIVLGIASLLSAYVVYRVMKEERASEKNKPMVGAQQDYVLPKPVKWVVAALSVGAAYILMPMLNEAAVDLYAGSLSGESS